MAQMLFCGLWKQAHAGGSNAGHIWPIFEQLEPGCKVAPPAQFPKLMTNAPDRAFVSWYYWHSAPVARLIAAHTSLRLAAQVALAALVFAVSYPVAALCADKCAKPDNIRPALTTAAGAVDMWISWPQDYRSGKTKDLTKIDPEAFRKLPPFLRVEQ